MKTKQFNQVPARSRAFLAVTNGFEAAGRETRAWQGHNPRPRPSVGQFIQQLARGKFDHIHAAHEHGGAA